MKLIDAKMIDFMGYRKSAILFSALLIAVSIISLATRGLSFGIDFTGGTLIEVGYPQPVDLPEVRSALKTGGVEEAVVQHFGTARDVLVRTPPKEGENSAELSSRVLAALKKGDAGAEMRRVEFVGPQVGGELVNDGGLAMLYALIGILIYVAMRFEYRFSLGSVIALIHDVIITLGVFSVFQLEFDLVVLAAVLAVIGYSLNDTIVVFDRIRENFRKMRKEGPVEVVNVSLTQTLSRTLMTSGTTLLVLVALFFIGGSVIHNFSLALIVGIVIGTYSSIYVASTVALALGVSKADLVAPPKEGGEGASELENAP
ncbi:protein translocase subunit SecF [Endothiovibrio diazotrophicus]